MTERQIIDALTTLHDEEQREARRRMPAARPDGRRRAAPTGRALVPLAAALAVGWFAGVRAPEAAPESFEFARPTAATPPSRAALPDSAPPRIQVAAAPLQTADVLPWSPPLLRPTGRYRLVSQRAQPPPVAPIEAPPPPPVAAALDGGALDEGADLVASLGLHRFPPRVL